MKLIKSYIAGFGNVKNLTTNYDDFNCVCRPNGYGKTTHAAFLKAMFFGLDVKQGASKKYIDREQYLPAGGGPYGGSVEFEYLGDTYKVERVFSSKAKDDTVSVKKNGVQVKDMPAVFGLSNAESFLRTLSIDAQDIDISTNDEINSRLASVVGGEGDGKDGDDKVGAALKKLKEKSNAVKKKKDEALKKILSFEGEIRVKSEQKQALSTKYDDLGEIDVEIAKLSARQKELNSVATTAKDWDRYDEMIQKAEDADRKCAFIEEKYPASVPAAEDVANVYEAMGREDTRRRTMPTMSEEKIGRLENLNKNYRRVVDDGDAYLLPLEGKFDEYRDLTEKIKVYTSRQLSDKERNVFTRFGINKPDDAFVARLDKAAEEYREAEKALLGASHDAAGVAAGAGAGAGAGAAAKVTARTADVGAAESRSAPSAASSNVDASSGGMSREKRSGPALWITLFVIALAAIIGGIVIAVANVSLVAGCVVAAVGFVVLVVTAILYINSRTSTHSQVTMPAGLVEDVENRANERWRKAFSSLSGMLALYGIDTSRDIMFAVATFKSEYEIYKGILAADEERKNEVDSLIRKQGEVESVLIRYFNDLNIFDGDIFAKHDKLAKDLNELDALSFEKKNIDEARGKIKKDGEEDSRVISEFCAKYKISEQKLKDDRGTIESDSKNYLDCSKRSEESKVNAEDFKTRNCLGARVPGFDDVSAELEDVEKKLETKRHDKVSLEKEIERDEIETADIEELDAKKSDLEEEAKRYADEERLLNKAQELLFEADKSVKDDFILPVQENFDKYAEMYALVTGRRVEISSDFSVVVSDGNGKLKDAQLSSGERSILAYLFRVALIERMYPGDKPFVILDDPFVNLDEENFVKVKDLVKLLSGTYQTLYFTCHESRKIT